MRRHVIPFAGVLALVACDMGPSPPIIDPPVVERSMINGVVYEVDAQGRRPVAGAGIDISPEIYNGFSSTLTDSDGRFSAHPPTGPGDKIIASTAGYSQPCRVPVGAPSDGHEVYLVSNGVLSSTGIPSALPLSPPVMTGRVFERTPQGDEPIAGASVVIGFDVGDELGLSATTITDPGGRYLVCNIIQEVGQFAILTAWVRKEGYVDAFADVHSDGAGLV